jgi:hypothetical protein
MGSHKSTSLDVIAVVPIWAVVMTVLTFTGFGGAAVLAILALPFVLVFPGYAFTAALFPKRSFGAAEQLLFSLGMSLVIVVLGGLLLDLTPFGLEARSWTVFLSGFMICASAVAYARRSEMRPSLLERPFAAVPPRAWLLFGLAAALAAGSIVVSSISAKQQEAAQGYAVFWMLPSTDSAQKRDVRLGVASMQPVTTSYSVEVSVNGKAVHTWDAITLKPQQRWEVTLSLPPGRIGGNDRVEAVLRRSTTPAAIYRHVVLWLRP